VNVFSGTGEPRYSRTEGHKMIVVVVVVNNGLTTRNVQIEAMMCSEYYFNIQKIFFFAILQYID